MKKIILTSFAILSCLNGFAQNGQKFSVGLNSLSQGDALGSSNNQSLVIKTNSAQRAIFGTDGSFLLNSLAGSSNRLLQTDANGNIIPFDMGSASQVLYGNGTWGNLPPDNDPWQVSGANTIFYNGNVGINNPHPQYAFDISGDAHISNNLLVGGGILISPKVQVGNSLKTDTIHAMSAQTYLSAPTKLGSQLQVMGSSIFNGPVTAQGSFNAATISANNLDVSQSLSFNGGQARIAFTPASSSTLNSNIISFGSSSNARGPSLSNTCFYPPSASWLTQFPDAIQIYNTNAQPNNINLMTIGYDGLNNIIDVAGINPSASQSPALLINYYCGKDIKMCTGTGTLPNNGGTAGGFVFTGPNMQIGSVNSSRNPAVAMNIGSNGAQTTAINVDANGNNIFKLANNGSASITDGDPNLYNPILTLTHSNGSTLNFLANGFGDFSSSVAMRPHFNTGKDFSVFEGIPGSGTLRLKIDGATGNTYLAPVAGSKVLIGTKAPIVGQHDNSVLSVFGDITTTAIYVTDPSAKWADFVFDNNYKLMSLTELESYYKKNHHLPNVPSTKEIQEKGNNLAETDAILLQKIEELTLYLVEQKKMNEQQQKEIEELKAKLSK